MMPKDLLKDLEKGDRTKEILSPEDKPNPSEPPFTLASYQQMQVQGEQLQHQRLRKRLRESARWRTI